MKHKRKTGDAPIFVPRFDPRQVRYALQPGADADLSFSDGVNIEAVKPGKRKGAKVETTIENTKPEL